MVEKDGVFRIRSAGDRGKGGQAEKRKRHEEGRDGFEQVVRGYNEK
jgi:hypothetical protein